MYYNIKKGWGNNIKRDVSQKKISIKLTISNCGVIAC